MQDLRELLSFWRADPQGTYLGWFLWAERIKNFRSIRRGVLRVVEEIEQEGFGNVFKGSSLETVVASIAEQKQIFRGAEHAFVWKPKLRIPDIYENPINQRAFGRLLRDALDCSRSDEIITAIQKFEEKKVKGLGPATANLLYFLHPTHLMPFNTAIVKGYNALTGAKVKLGRWTEYLAMLEGVYRLNQEYRDLLSNDFGAIAGFLFDVGSGRYSLGGDLAESVQSAAWQSDLEKVRRDAQANSNRSSEADLTHTQLQGWLRDLGLKLGFDVFVAANDRSRSYGEGKLGDGCLEDLPAPYLKVPGVEVIRFIDIIWVERGKSDIIAAFEIEHSTSIYSGILRLCDLACGEAGCAIQGLFLVAPDLREEEVRRQVARPAFKAIKALEVGYVPYSELEQHRDSMARFGNGLKAIKAVARKI